MRDLTPYSLSPFGSHIGQRGATIADFALTAPIFFFLLFGIFEFGRYMLVEHTLRYAVIEGARVGQVGGVATGQTVNEANRLAAIEAKVRTSAQIAINPADLTINLYVVTQPNFTDPADWQTRANVPGAGGAFMKLRVRYTLNFMTQYIGQFFTNGRKELITSVLYRNEPFDQ